MKCPETRAELIDTLKVSPCALFVTALAATEWRFNPAFGMAFALVAFCCWVGLALLLRNCLKIYRAEAELAALAVEIAEVEAEIAARSGANGGAK